MGKQGTLAIDDWDCDGKIVRCIDKEDVWEEEIIQTAAGPTKTMAPRNKNSVETIPLSMPDGVTDSILVTYDQFIDAIEGEAELTIKPEQVMRVMKVMEAAFESDAKAQAIITNI